MPDELLLFAGLTVAFDQASKAIVINHLSAWPRRSVASMPRVKLCRNEQGICLGLVDDIRLLLGLWCLIVSGTVAAALYLPPLQSILAQAGLGAAIGGASSNLLDCIWRGGVIDFIDLRIWPAFNLADLGISIGSGIALWIII